jgi:hypothetical protein
VSEINDARIEADRCRRNIAQGGDPEFWLKRLSAYVKKLDAAATILKMQMAQCHLEHDRRRKATTSPKTDTPEAAPPKPPDPRT